MKARVFLFHQMEIKKRFFFKSKLLLNSKKKKKDGKDLSEMSFTKTNNTSLTDSKNSTYDCHR